MLSLSLAVCTVASATPAYMKLGDIKGECDMSVQALLALKSSQPQAVALLLPAVQQVCEVAARMPASVIGPMREVQNSNAPERLSAPAGG